MGDNRNTDSQPQAENDRATGKPDDQPAATKDEMTKAQEDAARERANKGGYQ
ncbi:hypothetical protein FBZ83_12269 [Azospirillum brasilense]|uniref:Uncharacterized protein n=1 Tax=Azospirillum brasilense TaxID=192 RepID=A0A560BSZ0_AZOBR|nr:hypothetical protein [Azospirillum brasilense]TWA75716.1 hypothetical protein FBZ83_12269 [Azospirillum brasilense]